MEDAEKQVFAALSDQNFTQYNFLRNKYYSYTHLSSILEIYAFGTIQDYFHNENSLPKLNKAQLSRLRQLTLIGLVQDKIDVPIDTIRADLCLESETWLLDLMSLNNQVAIKFKIDEVGQIIHVEHLTQTRDVLSSQDKPLRILSRDQVGCDVSRLINMLKFIRDVKLAKVKDALSGSEKAAEDAASTRRSSQLKRRLEG